MKTKKDKRAVKEENDYLDFLRKRVFSLNYKNNVSKEEYDKTKAKYEKEKLKSKLI